MTYSYSWKTYVSIFKQINDTNIKVTVCFMSADINKTVQGKCTEGMKQCVPGKWIY